MKVTLTIIGISVACIALAGNESWGAYYTMMVTGVGVMFWLTRERD